MNPKVDFYFNKSKWQKEIVQLREIVLDCGLTEELKWGCPCYTFDGANIVLIHVFKEYCALLFFKGVLLQNKEGLLIQQTANVQSARQMRFTAVKQITKNVSGLKAYIYEAVEVQKAGLKVPLKETVDYKIPEEFQQKLKETPGLRNAFYALTPGRQRAYLFYFGQPKLSKTRVARLEKYVRKILDGKGLDD